MRRFQAKYPGACRQCGGIIKVGAWVATEPGVNGLLCPSCVSVAVKKQPSRRGGKKAFAAAMKAQGPL